MVKILAVDDEPDMAELIRQKFRKQIRDKEYEFDFACNGLEAFQKLKSSGNFDIVLTDINMPEMDGLTLLSQINQEELDVKTVIVSAYGDMDNIRKAMNFGAFDFITKPVDFRDLEVTINKTIKFVREHRRLVAIEQELSIAQSVQRTILTQPAYYQGITELDTDVRYHPMNQTVSGDYYHIDRLKVGIATVLLADASGHGLQAALSTMQVDILNKESYIINYPNERLAYINHLLVSELKSRNFFTCFAMDIYHDKILFSSAGHVTQFLIRFQKKEILPIKPNGKPIGSLEGSVYKLQVENIEKGDMIFLFTDGLPELSDPDGNEFGEEHFLSFLKTVMEMPRTTPMRQINDLLWKQMEEFRNGSLFEDDITLISIRLQ
jgi:sigma-B regulation protein RsbU (phosphoserine phosphatase)